MVTKRGASVKRRESRRRRAQSRKRETAPFKNGNGQRNYSAHGPHLRRIEAHVQMCTAALATGTAIKHNRVEQGAPLHCARRPRPFKSHLGEPALVPRATGIDRQTAHHVPTCTPSSPLSAHCAQHRDNLIAEGEPEPTHPCSSDFGHFILASKNFRLRRKSVYRSSPRP